MQWHWLGFNNYEDAHELHVNVDAIAYICKSSEKDDRFHIVLTNGEVFYAKGNASEFVDMITSALEQQEKT